MFILTNNSFIITKCILTEILSLAKNDIDRDISLDENDIDRDISLAENDIDREGQQQDKKTSNMFLLTKPLSASAETPSLWLKMILTEISLWLNIILTERVSLEKQREVL